MRLRTFLPSILAAMLACESPVALAEPAKSTDPGATILSIDTMPVTASEMYQPENVRRIRLLDTDYCAPRIGSLVVYQTKTDNHPRGAQANLDPKTLANFDNAPWRKGKPNPNWGHGMTVGITPSNPDWGFPGVFKLRTGISLQEIKESDFSTLDAIRKSISEVDAKDRQFMIRLNGEVALVQWRSTGTLRISYAVAKGITGTLHLPAGYLEQLPALQEVALHFFRPC